MYFKLDSAAEGRIIPSFPGYHMPTEHLEESVTLQKLHPFFALDFFRITIGEAELSEIVDRYRGL